MKNSKLRRILLTLACAVLLVSLSVGATLAYLTSTTEVVENTFTVGKIKIRLDEAAIKEYNSKTNSYDQDADKARVQKNTYKIRPGVQMWKDPTIHVEANSDDCYIRAIVTITYKPEADAVVDVSWIQERDTTNFTWYNPTTTENLDEEGKVASITREYEVRYNGIFTSKTTEYDLALFKGINVPTELNNTEIAALADFKINIIAHAIQSDGFVDADGNPSADVAWAAFDAQMAANKKD